LINDALKYLGSTR